MGFQWPTTNLDSGRLYVRNWDWVINRVAEEHHQGCGLNGGRDTSRSSETSKYVEGSVILIEPSDGAVKVPRQLDIVCNIYCKGWNSIKNATAESANANPFLAQHTYTMGRRIANAIRPRKPSRTQCL